MASEFQSSFIPKEPANQEGFAKSKTTAFGLVSLLVFIIVLLATGALFGYKFVLKGEISALESELAQSEKNIDKNSINQLAEFSNKLGVVQSLVDKHKVVSIFLDSFASSSVRSAQFTNFEFSPATDGGISVTLNGIASGYSAVALQEKVFLENPHFKSAEFSDLKLGENGKVSFTARVKVDPKASEYVPPAEFLQKATTTTTATVGEGDLSAELEDFGSAANSLEVDLGEI